MLTASQARLRQLGSLLLPCADEAGFPVARLVVDQIFSALVHQRLTGHRPSVVREDHGFRRRSSPPDPTSDRLATAIAERLGTGRSSSMPSRRSSPATRSIGRCSTPEPLRQGEGDDYLSPDDRAYQAFITALLVADQFQGHATVPSSRGACRGNGTGTRPSGLGQKPVGASPIPGPGGSHAVVQLRREDQAGRCGTWSGSRPGSDSRAATGLRMIPASGRSFCGTAAFTATASTAPLGKAWPPRMGPGSSLPARSPGGGTRIARHRPPGRINLARYLEGNPGDAPATTMLGGLLRYLGRRTTRFSR